VVIAALTDKFKPDSSFLNAVSDQIESHFTVAPGIQLQSHLLLVLCFTKCAIVQRYLTTFEMFIKK